jgi:hypothetical protein
MENSQENNKKETSFGFKPNWGIVFLLTFIVFLGAFLGGYLASIIGSGGIVKKIRESLDKKPEQNTSQISPKLKLSKAKANDDDDSLEENEQDLISKHKKFRDESISVIRKYENTDED